MVFFALCRGSTVFWAWVGMLSDVSKWLTFTPLPSVSDQPLLTSYSKCWASRKQRAPVIVHALTAWGQVLRTCCTYRNAQSKNSVDICRQILEKGGRIEQEFAEFFTGTFNHIFIVHTYWIVVTMRLPCSCGGGRLCRGHIHQGEECDPWAVGQLYLGALIREHLVI